MQQHVRPDPARGAYSAPPDLAGFKGAVSRRGGEGGRREWDGNGKGGEGQGEGKGVRGKVDSDAQLEQGRRLAKAGPAWSTTRPNNYIRQTNNPLITFITADCNYQLVPPFGQMLVIIPFQSPFLSSVRSRVFVTIRPGGELVSAI